MLGKSFSIARRSAFISLLGMSLWVACSGKDNDFFGDPAAHGGSGGSGAAGAASGGKGGASGSTGAKGGSSGTDATGASGGVGNSGGLAASGGNAGTGTAGSPQPTGGAGGSAGASGGASGSGGSGGSDVSGSGGDTSAEGGAAGAGAMSGAGAGGEPQAGAGGASGASGASGSTGTAGTGVVPPPTCGDDGDCADTDYCKKATCSATSGECKTRPGTCVGTDATFVPVCGCDHMTYFSPCVAAREGINVLSDGECTGNEQPTCTRTEGGASCDPPRKNARCYRPRVGCSGSSASEGVCWVLPDECPVEEKVNVYCGGSTGNAECVGLCEILDQDNAVWRDGGNCPSSPN